LIGGDQPEGDSQSESFGAWRRYLEALAEEHPLVLVFEDLHWADEGLLDFVDHLLEWSRNVPIYVVTLIVGIVGAQMRNRQRAAADVKRERAQGCENPQPRGRSLFSVEAGHLDISAAQGFGFSAEGGGEVSGTPSSATSLIFE